MTLNNLEKAIIKQFLTEKGVSIADDDTFFSDLNVDCRDFSGVGFITNLNKSPKLNVGTSHDSYKWGNLGAKLNSSIDTGYLLYVENGCLNTIEGYTYTEDWPDDIFQIETYAS